MKILAIADRPARKPIREILSEQTVDLIITLGDLELGQIRELEYIHGIPKIGVYGNHDSGNYMQQLGIKNMHLQTWSYQGITFGGFEGSVRYKPGSAPMYTQEEAAVLMKDFPAADVFLSHCPPYGINDDPTDTSHTGFKALTAYLEQNHPKYLLHGHTYPSESEMIREYQGTSIVYIYQDRLIEIL